MKFLQVLHPCECEQPTEAHPTKLRHRASKRACSRMSAAGGRFKHGRKAIADIQDVILVAAAVDAIIHWVGNWFKENSSNICNLMQSHETFSQSWLVSSSFFMKDRTARCHNDTTYLLTSGSRCVKAMKVASSKHRGHRYLSLDKSLGLSETSKPLDGIPSFHLGRLENTEKLVETTLESLKKSKTGKSIKFGKTDETKKT